MDEDTEAQETDTFFGRPKSFSPSSRAFSFGNCPLPASDQGVTPLLSTHQEGAVLCQEAVKGATAWPSIEPQNHGSALRILLGLHKPGGGAGRGVSLGWVLVRGTGCSSVFQPSLLLDFLRDFFFLLHLTLTAEHASS